MARKQAPAKKRGSSKSAAKAPRKAAKKSRAAAKPKASGGISDNFAELVGRALTDKDFRQSLFKDRTKATRGFALTKNDRSALDRLTPEVLESQAARLGGRAALTIKVVISKSF
ncbi:MAG: Os1348 family NHLP clan protein [Acidobacteriota bacterium]